MKPALSYEKSDIRVHDISVHNVHRVTRLDLAL